MSLPTSKPHLLYIDCARGYAVLMVITCHLTYQFPELPYPVHRLTTMGWFGVQLFFLASCLTLLMSWNFEARKNGRADAVNFFIRRYFRIAPAYYAAGVFYYFFAHPASGFSLWQAFTSAAFINAWHPAWTPTVQNAWAVVPGGWSIGVEFSFYLLFPFFAVWVTSLRRALLCVLASVVVGVFANLAALALLTGSYQPMEISNFLFYWFPNEISVFALGGVLYFLVRKSAAPDGPWFAFVQKRADLCAFGALAVFAALALVPLGHYSGGRPFIPASLAVSLPLMGLVIALSSGRGVLVNRAAAAIGKVSFSAYLLHFAFLHLFDVFPETFHTHATGFGAIAAFTMGLVVIVPLIYAASWCSYRAIELPMMDVGKAVIRARRAVRSAKART